MRRLVPVCAVASALVLSASAGAKSWPSLEFRPALAKPGDLVSVRVSLTHFDYVAPPRPGGPRIEILLVPDRIARTVNSVDEPGVVRVAVIRADLAWRGRATFRLPDLPAGRYAGAYRIARVFYTPRADAPLDNHGFSLQVRGADSRSGLEQLGIGGFLTVLAAGLLARRSRRAVRMPARR